MTGSGKFVIDSIELAGTGTIPIVKGSFSAMQGVSHPTVVRFVTLDEFKEPIKVFQCYVDWDKIQANGFAETQGRFQSDEASWDFCDLDNHQAKYLQVSVFLETEEGPESIITGSIKVEQLKSEKAPQPLTGGVLYEDDFEYKSDEAHADAVVPEDPWSSEEENYPGEKPVSENEPVSPNRIYEFLGCLGFIISFGLAIYYLIKMLT